MATMFPDRIESFTTVGEKKVYEFLRKTAKPDNLFLVWYSPDIEDREPDFILFSPDCGLIVLEVKDWISQQILEADPKNALLRIGQKEELRKQPLAQAREYVNSLRNLLAKKFSSSRQIPCPITWGAVFPHMSREEFHKSGLATVMEERRVICWDELAPGSPLEKDVSGQTFRNFILEHFPPLFSFTLTASQINSLRAAIFPIVRIDVPTRGYSKQDELILSLDHSQENLARKFGHENNLISGPAGSGKTLILVHQAWHMPRVNKKVQRILITCFNLSLVGYIRRLLSRKGVSLGSAGVEVIPFYKLCEKILGENLNHTNEGYDYYKLVVAETLERLTTEHPLKGNWDMILVDEGQDFSREMAQVIVSLLPAHGFITVCEDDNQRLYRSDANVWESVGLENLHKHRFNCQYRNSRPIAALAAKVLKSNEQISYLGANSEKKPEWLISQNEEEQLEILAKEVASLVQKGVPCGEIAILYIRNFINNGKSYPERIIEALETQGLLSRWIARDVFSKQTYDITTDTVTISTIHSVKGLDYACVFLLGLDGLNPANEKDRHLAHVGITRARECLYLCIMSKEGLAAELMEK